MRIFVRAKAGSREDKVIPPVQRLIKGEEKEYYTLYTKELPVNGMANDAYVRLLAEYFKVPRTKVSLISGATSKIKVFKINEK